MPLNSELWERNSNNFGKNVLNFGKNCNNFGRYKDKWVRNFARKTAEIAPKSACFLTYKIIVFSLVAQQIIITGIYALYFGRNSNYFRKNVLNFGRNNNYWEKMPQSSERITFIGEEIGINGETIPGMNNAELRGPAWF